LEREDFLNHYQHFAYQLAQCREWEELTRFVTEFPGTFLPLSHTALFIYDHQNARLESAAEWNAAGDSMATTPAWPSPEHETCQSCLVAKPLQMHPLALRSAAPTAARDEHRDDFCLPLVCKEVLVGVLRLRCQPNKVFTPGQLEFMNSISSEIALALVLVIAYPRQIAQARNAGQAEARRQMARILHGSVAQQIGFLHLALDRLASHEQPPHSDAVREELEHLRQVAGNTYQQIRYILSVLRAEVQADRANTDHAATAAQDSHLQLSFNAQALGRRLPAHVRQAIFTLLQEGLNNIEQHAQAQHASLALRWSAESLNMSLVDDGVGFTAPAAPEDGHYGLAMMHELVKELGGEMTVESDPSHGTRLGFRIPLQHPPAHTPNDHFAYPRVST
jgi:signal transduction histidine kinase